MFGQFSEEARKMLTSAKREMYDLKHPYVGSEHLLLAILKSDNSVSKKLKSYKLTYNIFKEEIINTIGYGTTTNDWFLYTPLLKRIIENALLDSKENNNGNVTIEHLFSSLLEEGEGVALRIMIGMNIDIDNLYKEFSSKLINTNKQKKNKKLLIEELGVDLTKKAFKGELDPVIGRKKEVQRLLEILCRRNKNNPILIGEAGVGKTAIVEELSRMVAYNDVPYQLRNKKIILLDMATMVAGTKYRGEFEERVRKVLKEIEENDDIILFIDEIHTLVGAGGAEGAIDASNIFKPALARGKLRLIGATTISEYKKYIENDGALDRRFQKIVIDIPTKETVQEILVNLKPIYEKFHMVEISNDILSQIVELSDKYIHDRNQPDKAIDILDEVCSHVNLIESEELKTYKSYSKEMQKITKYKNDAIINNDFKLASEYKTKEKQLMDLINNLELSVIKNDSKKLITKEDVALIINEKTNIPVYELLKENEKVIERIYENISSKIMGQNNAIDELITIAKRVKMGFNDDNKCYSLLFCGPSGVGKTSLAKIYGEQLVGKRNIIKLDMSEYSESHSISKIVGAPPGYVGYSDFKNILEEIRNKPNSVLILDEIEKANSSVINLFFQILDDGKIKDSKGIEVRFDNVLIIMTSNIGYSTNNIGFSHDNNAITNKLKEYFSIPFINRIDNIIPFNYLDEISIRKLILDKLGKLKEKYKKRGKSVQIQKDVIDELIIESNYKEYGARKIDKLLKDKIENQIIEKILSNKKRIIISNVLTNIHKNNRIINMKEGIKSAETTI